VKLRDRQGWIGSFARLAASGLALAGCTTAPRLDTPPAAAMDAAPPGFSRPIRADVLDRAFFEANVDKMTEGVRASADGSIDILALSGGGAGGAFGAGVVVGLTKAHARPRFEVVTGVSTGALISSFAFLGPDWDDELTEAFSGKSTNDLMVSRGLGALFGVGVFQGEPLRRLVDRFVTPELVAAVAEEAKTGRLLLVATTNLDREETQIWNLGAIAMEGNEKSRDLFRDVLIASASVPGVFPPVMIEVTEGGKTFQEMHVDGGASTPFFIAPDIAMILGFAPEALRGGNVYVVVNAQAASMPRSTRNNTVDIVARSFTAVLNHMTRTMLSQTDAFAARNNMSFRFTVMPQDVAFGGSLAFEEPSMKSIFDYGMRCAAANQVWVTPQQALDHAMVASKAAVPVPPDQAGCPLLEAPK
jgi:predicted acylesterase/phospholipase RssA